MMALAIVAGVAIAGIVILSLAFAQTIRGMQRQHAREREQLLDKLCHLAGKPWTPAPVDDWTPPDLEPLELVATPEQEPDW